MTGNAYRHGLVHVQSERCATCVFRPGNLMSLEKGRLADLIEQNRLKDSALTCHETLDANEHGTIENAVCRGFYDLEPKTTPLRLAEEFGIIREVQIRGV